MNDRTGCGSGETGAGPLMRLILLKQFCKLFLIMAKLQLRFGKMCVIINPCSEEWTLS